MTKGLHSEVRFANAVDILFVHFKSMFLTYGMSIRHDISQQCMYAFFRTGKRGKHKLGNLHCVISENLAFNAKLFRWISYVHKF